MADRGVWLKALHILSFTAWMAGLWYLPRLFIYHSQVTPGTEASEMYKVMERRLLRGITTPAMLGAIALGVALGVVQGQWTAGWLHLKTALVLALGRMPLRAQQSTYVGPASATKAHPSDAIQYVSTSGSDTNDGLSRGTAKATIQAAIDALPAGQLRLSDALVVTGGVVAALACGLAALVSLLWVLRAYAAAAELAGVRPSRSPAVVVAGWLVPVANLLIPGSTLAEIEHAALGRPAARRPTPSVLLMAWWASWVAGVLLAWLTIAWSFQDSTQAQADGVLLHAAADVVAAVVAILTAIVVRSLTRLLQPVDTEHIRRMQLLAVRPATASAPAPAVINSPGGRRRGGSGGRGWRTQGAGWARRQGARPAA